MDALLDELERSLAPRLGPRAKGALAAFGVGLFIARPDDLPPPCTDAAEQLHGIWDPQRSAEVERALAASAVPHAANTWALIRPELDGYARDWRRKHTEVCEATRVHETQLEEDMGLRMRCLSSARVALRETVGALAQPDDSTIDKAVTLVSGLPSPARCDDLEALRLQLPLPEDPREAQAVQTLRVQLVGAQVRHAAGDFEDAERRLDAIVEDARSLGHEPVLAEALWQRGELLDVLGRYDEAERELTEGYHLAVTREHRRIEARTASALAWVVGRQQHRVERGREWGRLALALAERRGTAPGTKAGAAGNLGALLHLQGEYDEALVHLRASLRLKESTDGPRHPSVADTLDVIGHVLLAQGQVDEAIEHYERARSIRETILGDRHPAVAASLGNIGNVLASKEQYDEALRYFHRALRLQRRLLGPEHHDVARTLGNIGHIQWSQGELAEALLHHQQALTILDREGSQSLDLARTAGNIAITLYSMDRPEEALAQYRRALSIFEATTPGDPVVATTLDNMALVLQQLGRLDEALAHQQRAVALLEQVFGPQHPSVAGVAINVGRTQLHRDRPRLARPWAQRALEIYERADAPAPPSPHLLLAEIAAALGSSAEQHHHAQQVLSRCPEGPECDELRAEALALLPTSDPSDAATDAATDG